MTNCTGKPNNVRIFSRSEALKCLSQLVPNPTRTGPERVTPVVKRWTQIKMNINRMGKRRDPRTTLAGSNQLVPD